MKFLPLGLMEPCVSGRIKCKIQRAWKIPRKQDFLNQHSQCSKSTQTEEACIGLHTQSVHQVLCICIIVSSLVGFFYVITEYVNKWVSDSYDISWALFFLLFCLFLLQCNSFCFVLCFSLNKKERKILECQREGGQKVLLLTKNCGQLIAAGKGKVRFL